MIAQTTAYHLIHKALRAVGIVGLGDYVDPLVSQEALLILNGMRAEWSLNTKDYKVFNQVCSPVTNKQFITLGTDGVTPGDIPVRPSTITSVIVIVGTPGGPSNNLTLPVYPYAQYFQNTVQNITALPTAAYVDNQMPYTNVYLYPGITAGYSIRVIGTSYLTEYESIADAYVDPPEYWDALYLNLALRLAVLYNFPAPQGTVMQASAALKHIQAHQLMLTLQNMPDNLGGGSPGSNVNFLSGLPS